MSKPGESRRDQIDQYVNEQMEAGELADFEQRMRENVALAESVHLHRDVQKGMEYYFLQGLKQDLIRSDAKKPKSKLPTYLAIAATVLIMAGAGLTYYLEYENRSPETLFTAYFEPYPNIIAPVQRSASGQQAGEAMQFYEAGQYAQAITVFDRLISQEPENAGLTFYRGVCYLGNNQPEKAATDFQTVIQSEDNPFLQASHWYLGLSYLKLSNTEEAKKHLAKVRATEGKLADEAAEILSDI